LGLGLYIVKSYIENLNGEIYIDSKETEFTSIKFYIITERINSKFNDILQKTPEFKISSSPFPEDIPLESSNLFDNKTSHQGKLSNTTRSKYQDNQKKYRTIKINELIEAENSSYYEENGADENISFKNNIVQGFKIKEILIDDNEKGNNHNNNYLLSKPLKKFKIQKNY